MVVFGLWGVESRLCLDVVWMFLTIFLCLGGGARCKIVHVSFFFFFFFLGLAGTSSEKEEKTQGRII